MTVTDDDAPVPTCAVSGNQAVNTNNACTYVHPDDSWNGTAIDNCSAAGAITISYQLFGSTIGTTATLNGQAFNLGNTWVRMIAEDEAGNIDSCSFTVTVSDDDAPVPTCAVSGNQAVNTNSACTYVHPDDSWNGTAIDNCSAAGAITISYQLFGSTIGTTATLNGQAFNLGNTWVRMIAEDEAGNIDSCSFTVTVSDDDAPVPTCAVSGNQAVNTNSACTYVHPDDSWNGTAIDNCSAAGAITISYQLFGSTIGTTATLNGQAFNLGNTWVRMIAEDEAGNIDSCSFTVSVTDDDAPVPTCAVSGNQAVNTNSACTYVHPDDSWNGTAIDNCSAAGAITISYQLFGSTIGTTATLNGQAFNLGNTWVRMIAEDEAGNIDSCSFTVSVTDDDAPVPTCAVSGNQAVNTNSACTYVHPDDSWNGTAIDNCSAAGAITISYELFGSTVGTTATLNGQAFNLGNTWVRMIAEDEAGNIDSCSFTVSVTDDDAPVPTCAVSGNQAVNTNSACTYVHPDDSWNGTAIDNCSAAGAITISYQLFGSTIGTTATLNGQAFNLGNTWVRMIAEDEAGNIDSCSFTVSVTDDDAPVPTCAVSGNQAVNTNSACTYVHPDDSWNGTAIDNCSAAGAITISYQLFGVTTATTNTLNGQSFNLGNTWVRMIAEDEAGNIDSCSFTVSVTDDDAPVPTCAVSGNQAVNTNSACTYVHPDDSWNGTAIDNCSAAGAITISYQLFGVTTATTNTLNGQAFNLGNTWVRMIAEDEAGNIDSCSFTVTVSRR